MGGRLGKAGDKAQESHKRDPAKANSSVFHRSFKSVVVANREQSSFETARTRKNVATYQDLRGQPAEDDHWRATDTIVATDRDCANTRTKLLTCGGQVSQLRSKSGEGVSCRQIAQRLRLTVDGNESCATVGRVDGRNALHHRVCTQSKAKQTRRVRSI